MLKPTSPKGLEHRSNSEDGEPVELIKLSSEKINLAPAEFPTITKMVLENIEENYETEKGSVFRDVFLNRNVEKHPEVYVEFLRQRLAGTRYERMTEEEREDEVFNLSPEFKKIKAEFCDAFRCELPETPEKIQKAVNQEAKIIITGVVRLLNFFVANHINTAVFLDKSARYAAHLVRVCWRELHLSRQMPVITFINVGGESRDEKLEENQALVSHLRKGLLRHMQGARVAVVDDFEFTGDSLRRATNLLTNAFPEAQSINPVYAFDDEPFWYGKTYEVVDPYGEDAIESERAHTKIFTRSPALLVKDQQFLAEADDFILRVYKEGLTKMPRVAALRKELTKLAQVIVENTRLLSQQ
ncbi:hypothetical protein B5M47_01445 [candidate division CPR3 bacterium 4484_211]|uniref:Uncharacterized protein n=1 Tax=candidate division CPR3 bacterium 4484_211 TaxID=1968527 RepID=A0A1W9NYV8_UNCC3|nr:MAG: hypothetical protein B5M47_01445 [candidate division CPR3 bacterium 4484_211]